MWFIFKRRFYSCLRDELEKDKKLWYIFLFMTIALIVLTVCIELFWIDHKLEGYVIIAFAWLLFSIIWSILGKEAISNARLEVLEHEHDAEYARPNPSILVAYTVYNPALYASQESIEELEFRSSLDAITNNIVSGFARMNQVRAIEMSEQSLSSDDADVAAITHRHRHPSRQEHEPEEPSISTLHEGGEEILGPSPDSN